MQASAENLPRRLGRYEIVGRLAFGGMAEILLARLTGPSGFERPVVIKRILPQLLAEPAFVDMFLDEGRLAARIRHPNVVQVQELCIEDRELFLVMEYLEGEAVAGVARRCRVRARHVDRALAAYVVAEAAAGLHVAHELRGTDGEPLDIVHRDVSPENVFVGYDGTVKVLDFGIAKARDRITKTEAGMLKGKFDYMSPEQALGEPLDRRSDVFSLGIVLYELTTERRLFRRATQLATLRAATEEEIVLPSAIDPTYPRALEDICMQALARDRSLRFATALDLRRALLEALRDLRGPAMPEEALSTLMRDLFPDRIQQKSEMLSSMRQGVTPAHVPEADVDVAVEIPPVEPGAASEVRTRPFEPGRAGRRMSGRKKILVAIGAAALVAALGIAGAMGLFEDYGAAAERAERSVPATGAERRESAARVGEPDTDPVVVPPASAMAVTETAADPRRRSARARNRPERGRTAMRAAPRVEPAALPAEEPSAQVPSAGAPQDRDREFRRFN